MENSKILGFQFEPTKALQPDSSSFAWSWVDKVANGTWSFVSVIANVVALVSLDNTNLTDQTKMRLISQLVKGILRVLQKLLKCLMEPLFQHFLYHYHLLYLLFFV